ncbi:MAG: hypothetical protein ACL93V_13755 [Candidatus Electrothrix sp. YB6]
MDDALSDNVAAASSLVFLTASFWGKCCSIAAFVLPQLRQELLHLEAGDQMPQEFMAIATLSGVLVGAFICASESRGSGPELCNKKE